jgi:hypothetical protein
MPWTRKQLQLADAMLGSRCAAARLWGMKYRAAIDPPRAATGGFPYFTKTCAEWEREEQSPFRHKLPREMSDRQRKADAIRGSAALCEAIRRAA